jgi:hypothetical protein
MPLPTLRAPITLTIADSSNAYLGELFTQPSWLGASTTLTRYSGTGTIANASTAYIGPYIQFRYTSGTPVSVTLRIGMPQVEQSSYATSVIPTGGTTATRPADVYTTPAGGTYFDSNGILQTAAANVPRLDHSPVSPYAPQGILIEEGRTNLIANSSGTAGETSAGSYTVSSVLAPDNTTFFLKCAEGTGTGDQNCRWAPTFAASTTYTVSAFVKAAQISVFTILAFDTGGNAESATVNLTSGTANACSTSLGGAQGIQSLGNGIYRVWMSFTTGASPSGNYFDSGSQTPQVRPASAPTSPATAPPACTSGACSSKRARSRLPTFPLRVVR